jgi:hypothetical protein
MQSEREDYPTFLISDNYSSHKIIHVYEFCKRNGIVIISVPPLTTHHMQPLGITFIFDPLKSAFNTEFINSTNAL